MYYPNPFECHEHYDSYDYDSEAYDEYDYDSDTETNEEAITIDPHDNPDPDSKETYTVHFFDHSVETTVTSRPAVVRDWLYRVLSYHRFRRHKLVVGLGVQWNASSTINPPPAATLQLCIGSYCLILQLLHTYSVPLALRRFLNDPRNTFVGVWNHNDESFLWRSEHSLQVSRIVDIRHVAAERWGSSRQISMQGLAERVLGYVSDDGFKPEWVGRSDWDADWLSPEQVQYACVDALVSFLLGKELQVWNWNN